MATGHSVKALTSSKRICRSPDGPVIQECLPSLRPSAIVPDRRLQTVDRCGSPYFAAGPHSPNRSATDCSGGRAAVRRGTGVVRRAELVATDWQLCPPTSPDRQLRTGLRGHRSPSSRRASRDVTQTRLPCAGTRSVLDGSARRWSSSAHISGLDPDRGCRDPVVSDHT